MLNKGGRDTPLDFATLGEGTIIVRDASTGLSTGGTSIGSPDTYDGLNRDVTLAQYNTKEGGLSGGFTVDDNLVQLIRHPIETPVDSVLQIYQGLIDAKDTTVLIYNETGEVVEKTGNLIEYDHYTTDGKVKYYLTMDEYEALKASGGEITELDTFIYYKSKSATGEELTQADRDELRLASGIVIDEATDAILQNIKNNIKVYTLEDAKSDLAVLNMFDRGDASDARGYYAGVREREKPKIITDNTLLADTGIECENNTESNRSVIEIIRSWGEGVNNWGTEKNLEITNSKIVQNTHAAGEWMNEHPDQVLSTVTDFMPIIGQGKGVLDGLTGYDIITGEELGGFQRGLNIATVIPVVKVADKVGDVIKHVDDVEQIVKSGVPEQLLRGQNFEKVVLAERDLIKNTTKIENRIPDSLSNGVITEIKDVSYLYKNGQLRTFLETGQPVNLIISPKTKISAPLYDSIIESGGSIIKRTDSGVYTPYIP